MEGFPTAQQNKAELERLVRSYHGKPYPAAPYLIPPGEEPIGHRRGHRYLFDTTTPLPRVTCVGRLASISLASRESADLSGLVVIGFQEPFAFPIDPAVLNPMLLIDCEQQGYDWDF